MSQFFASRGQSIAVSASASVLPMNIQGCFPLGLTDLIFLESLQGTLKSLLRTSQFKNINSSCSAFVMAQLSNPYLTTGKIIALTIWTFVSKVMSLLFNTVSRFVIAFLPRSKRLLISWLQSLSAVIFEPKKIKSVTALNRFHLLWTHLCFNALCFPSVSYASLTWASSSPGLQALL